VRSGITTMVGDEMRVKQIMLNLITTLAKYAKSGSEIALIADADADGTTIIRVRGTTRSGTQQLAQMLESTSELGLTVVRRFVGLHGGEVVIEQLEGAISTIYATFPRQTDQSVLRAAG